MKKLIIGICGASGILYAIDLLKELKKSNIETHVIVSDWAKQILSEETKYKIDIFNKNSTIVYNNNDMAAKISSSSFLSDGMVIIPATVKTTSEIAHANCNNLITRCADNILRMKKRLILCIRETPLSSTTLENLYKISIAGGVVFPLCPAFYHNPENLEDIRNFIVGKIMDVLDIENTKFKRWKNE